MKVVILDKNGNMEVKNISCKGKDIEVASWDYIGEYITWSCFNKDKTLRCIFDNVFGWDIPEEDLFKYKNPYVTKIFPASSSVYNTVVITGYRNGKSCDVRKRDIDYIRGIIDNEKAIRKSE